MKTGFIGLGAMGASMARNIALAGLLSAVWNRNRNIALEFANQWSVDASENPADLASNCDLIGICVSADSDVLEVIDALMPGIQPGSVVADFSTVSSTTARTAAERLARRGAGFLDSPVSGGVEGARDGTLAMMIGGEESTLQRVMPVLKTLGKRIVHMGPVGSGQATKAVNQIMVAGINQAVTEALAFGEYQGLPLERLIDVVESGAAGNWFLSHRGRTMTRGEFKPGFKLKLHYKDLMICEAMAREMGFDSKVINSTLDDYSVLMQQGLGNEDNSALYRLKRPR